MIKILLDTNTVHDNWLAIGEAFTLLGELAARGKCDVFMSEISILEHVRHYQKRAPAIEQELKSKLSNYAKLFVDNPPLKSPPTLCDSATFEKLFRARLKELGITPIPIPKTAHSDLVARDLAERKPFASSGKGYRDVLIWLGFVDVVDQATTKAVVVTSNQNDFCGDDKTKLHQDLIVDLDKKHSGVEDLRFAAPQKLADEMIKPLLAVLAEQDAKAKKDQQKAQQLLKKIQEDNYKYFKLDDVVEEGMEYFESQETEGVFYAGSAALEEPLWVTMVENPTNIEATSVYRLKNGNYLCEGTAEVTATVEGYLDKAEAVIQSEIGHAYISTPHHNEWYSEVEVPNRPARITFSFEFEEKSSETYKFEVTKVESIR
jgi:hypothetical protein